MTPPFTSLVLCLVALDAEVGITTTDGIVVHGTLAQQQVTMRTPFGSATIDTDALVSIEFGAADVVRTRGDSVLRGTIRIDELTIRTDQGSETVSRAEMTELHATQHAELVPGEITDGVHWNESTYHLRAPEGYDPDAPGRWPALVVLHGTSSNSSMFIRGICARWPDIGRRYIMIGINGTTVSERSTPELPQYFYTFIEFAGRGTHDPVPGAERQSPLLVAEVVADLRAHLPVSTLFVSGHSQGGYMTFSTFMNYPELFDGALPSAGGMTKMAQVDAYADEELRARQRAVPVAIVHATNDDIVLFKYAEQAIESMNAAGFEHVRLFQNDTAGHRFLLLPYDQGLRWLEEVTAEPGN